MCRLLCWFWEEEVGFFDVFGEDDQDFVVDLLLDEVGVGGFVCFVLVEGFDYGFDFVVVQLVDEFLLVFVLFGVVDGFDCCCDDLIGCVCVCFVF